MDAALWYFFGKVCMANAPQDCQRIVFDAPMQVTDLNRPGLVPPLVFHSPGACMKAINLEFDLQKPLKVEGAEWVEVGCTREERDR